ncbi:hypothetical protein [Streptomyces sp. NPDC057280]|uniref:DNA polymerase thumb domain-containing protein n=1 Tax=Streptomyces sp. NPDC057280 TaxID=3346081 RepID=UPI0036401A01
MPEPDSAVADLSGALRFWHRDVRGIIELIQSRGLAFHGLRSSAGAGPNRMLAAMACALTPPGQRTIVENSPEAVDALRPRAVRELPDIGTRTATLLAEYGLHTIGDIADVPHLTLQRLLGARPGRTLHDRAHGCDTQTVDPTPTPASIGADHRFPRDELDPAAHGAPCSPSPTTSVPACVQATRSPKG